MQIAQKTRHLKTLAIIMLLVGFLVGGFLIYYNNRSAQAADLKNFNAGNIISDSVFYNYSTMSASQIQDFLNSKVKSCNGDYTCLKDYRSSTVSKPVDSYCSGYNASSSQSAAEIIYGVSQSCKINPQVLLVLLQKETGLVTHTGPGSWRYQTATGMGCPDTAACDSQYYGLFNQLYGAARQFKIYQAKPSNYRYVANRNNSIQWNPSASCGSTNVYIENQATAGLYNYTQYAPNQAALNAGYGTGNGCSSYGNRNFYLYFTDWFSTTQGVKEINNGVYRMWNPVNKTHFMTANINEANIYAASGWLLDSVSIFSTNSSPSMDVYRLYNKTTRSHFLTTNTAQVQQYLNYGWQSDGVVFKSPISGKAVYYLYNPYTNGYIYLSSLDELSAYVKSGWQYRGIAFYSNQTYDDSEVYSLHNSYTKSNFLTASQAELGDYIAAGWINDGIVFRSSKQPTDQAVYRLYSPVTNTHFMTSSEAELGDYIAAGWINDGIVFRATRTGKPVYRLYSTKTRSHMFTTDQNWSSSRSADGWINDGIMFYGNIYTNVTRLYNTKNKTHRLVVDDNIKNNLISQGWINDGVIFKAQTEGGVPIYELYNSSSDSYFYTNNQAELNIYVSSGWVNNGVIFRSLNSGLPIFRLYSPVTGKHLISSSQTEVNIYTNAGWINDGIVFYGNN